MAHKALDCITERDIEALGISSAVADGIYRKLAEIVRDCGPASPETWKRISTEVLNPDLPFSFHQMMYYGCYRNFGPDPPAWMPDPDSALLTNVGQLLERKGKEFLGSKYKDPISNFSDLQEFSVSQPEAYWKVLLDELSVAFSVPPECIFRESPSQESKVLNPGGQWLPGAFVNPAKICLSVNCKRSLDDIVIRWRDEGDDNLPVKSITVKELREEVWLVAHALNALGLDRGSSIAIDMPMHVYSVIIYLAIVLAGYIVVSIADSFAPGEISTRLKISEAKAIFTQDLIIRGEKSIPLYSRVVEAQAPKAIVIPVRGSGFSMKLRDCDISWLDFLEKVRHLKYILYFVCLVCAILLICISGRL